MRQLFTVVFILCAVISKPSFAQTNFAEEMKMMKASEAQTIFIDNLAKMARDKNEEGIFDALDPALLNAQGKEQIREVIQKQLFPFFSLYEKLNNYTKNTKAQLQDGRVGLWHYTYIVDNTGKTFPFQVAIIDTDKGPKVANILVGQCVKGRHPAIPPCQ